MRFREFTRLLAERTDFHYAGSTGGLFRGLTFKPRDTNLRGRFLAIPGPDWDEFTVERYTVSDHRVPHVVRRALGNGARGVVLPLRFRDAPFLNGVDAFFVNSTLDFSLRAAEVVGANRGQALLTAITGSAGKSTTKAMIVHAMRAMLS